MNLIVKFRTGNHDLATEIGRYKNRREYDECICSFCDDNSLEDLYHFIAACPRYYEVRELHIPLLANVDRPDFYVLMDKLRPRELQSLTKYLTSCIDIRNNE